MKLVETFIVVMHEFGFLFMLPCTKQIHTKKNTGKLKQQELGGGRKERFVKKSRLHVHA